MNRLYPALVCALLLACCSPAATAAPIVSVLGDSISAGNGSVVGIFPNWVYQMAVGRSMPVHNFAVGGATASSLLAGQLAAAVADLPTVDYTMLMIGGNDAAEAWDTYIGGGDAAAQLGGVVADIVEAVDTLQQDGAQLVVATIPNILVTPVLQDGGTADQRAAFGDLLTAANQDLAASMNTRQVPLFDLDELARQHADAETPLVLGATSIAYADRFGADGFHPGPALQGLFANSFLTALDDYYGENIPLLTDQQILNSAGRPATGTPSYFDVAPYVILPVPEPSTVILLSGGGACLLMLGGHRHSRHGRRHLTVDGASSLIEHRVLLMGDCK